MAKAPRRPRVAMGESRWMGRPLYPLAEHPGWLVWDRLLKPRPRLFEQELRRCEANPKGSVARGTYRGGTGSGGEERGVLPPLQRLPDCHKGKSWRGTPTVGRSLY